MDARNIALNILDRVIQEKSYLNLALKDALNAEIPDIDKRFTTALTYTTLENLFRIDYVLEPFISGKRVHQKVKNILRLGVSQLLFFNNVPASAAIDESVKLAAAFKTGIFKSFVNAVLRNVEKNKGNTAYPDIKRNPAEYLHIMHSVPLWLSKKFITDYGFKEAQKIFAYKGEQGLTCVRRNFFSDGSLPDNLIEGKYLSDAYYVKNISGIENNAYYKSGLLTPQSESSMLCVRAADIKPADTVLDICAAPGGKASYAAWFAKKGKVIATDFYEHRVSLIKNNLKRLNIYNVETEQINAAKRIDKFFGVFDVVLADLPCSALGLIHRKPDIRVFKAEKDLKELSDLQKNILENVSGYVKPGGVLLYSTCTIDNIENESNVEYFLRSNEDFYLESISNFMPEGLKERAKNGMMQLFPHKDEIDGFFMARLKKQK